MLSPVYSTVFGIFDYPFIFKTLRFLEHNHPIFFDHSDYFFPKLFYWLLFFSLPLGVNIDILEFYPNIYSQLRLFYREL